MGMDRLYDRPRDLGPPAPHRDQGGIALSRFERSIHNRIAMSTT
jgi:hypothetical protein